MTSPYKLVLLTILTILSATLFLWSIGVGHTPILAEDEAPTDKWVKIQENNKKMLETLKTIEDNLNFTKARAMGGGRSS